MDHISARPRPSAPPGLLTGAVVVNVTKVPRVRRRVLSGAGGSAPSRPAVGMVVVAVVVVSLLGWATLVLAAWQGWLGADVGRGGAFCEASHPGLLKQPVNTLSNLGFTAAGLGIAVRVRAVMPALRAPLTALSVIVALLGPASAAMHATETAVGGRLDLLSMYLLVAFALAYALVRSDRLGLRGGAVAFVGLVVVCEVVGSLPVALPVLMHPGNAAFAALLVGALVVEANLIRAGRAELRWGLASVGTLLLAFAIWNLAKDGSPLCHPHSLLQGHGAWHLLDALAANFLARHYEVLGECHPAVSGPRAGRGRP